jgi:hypothetical protein
MWIFARDGLSANDPKRTLTVAVPKRYLLGSPASSLAAWRNSDRGAASSFPPPFVRDGEHLMLMREIFALLFIAKSFAYLLCFKANAK